MPVRRSKASTYRARVPETTSAGSSGPGSVLSQPVDSQLTRAFAQTPRVQTLFVHVWAAGERIYETGVPERGYTPDPSSAAALRRVAELAGGRVFEESDADATAAAAAELLGGGPSRQRVIEGERRALMPYATMLALLPLGFVLFRRNL